MTRTLILGAGFGGITVATELRERGLRDREFFAAPEPRVQLGHVSQDHARAKHRFEAERLERWFGR